MRPMHSKSSPWVIARLPLYVITILVSPFELSDEFIVVISGMLGSIGTFELIVGEGGSIFSGGVDLSGELCWTGKCVDFYYVSFLRGENSFLKLWLIWKCLQCSNWLRSCFLQGLSIGEGTRNSLIGSSVGWN